MDFSVINILMFLFQIDTKRTFSVFANITYDGVGQRFRIDESVATNRTTEREYYDVYLFFKEVCMKQNATHWSRQSKPIDFCTRPANCKKRVKGARSSRGRELCSGCYGGGSG